MAVKSYSLNGKLLWKVSAEARSSTDSSVRVQKAKFALESEEEAQRFYIPLLRECEREVSRREMRGSRWGTVVDAWCEFQRGGGESRLVDSTRLDYEAMLRNYTQRWWKRPAALISRADIRDLLNQMKVQGRSRKHQLKMKSLLTQVFVFGAENRLIRGMEVVPTIGIQVGKAEEEKKPEILTIAELRTLLFKARERKSPWYYHWALALLTGMRSGELYALLWTDIDWENGLLSVNKSYNGRIKAVKGTKAGYWRTVPISAELRRLLEQMRNAETEDSNHVLPRLWQWTKGEQARELRRFCMESGLPSIRFHALRACFATQLIRNGVAPIQVMKICGWRDLQTMQRYIRISGIELEGATELLKLLPDEVIMDRAAVLFSENQKPSLGITQNGNTPT